MSAGYFFHGSLEELCGFDRNWILRQRRREQLHNYDKRSAVEQAAIDHRARTGHGSKDINNKKKRVRIHDLVLVREIEKANTGRKPRRRSCQKHEIPWDAILQGRQRRTAYDPNRTPHHLEIATSGNGEMAAGQRHPGVRPSHHEMMVMLMMLQAASAARAASQSQAASSAADSHVAQESVNTSKRKLGDGISQIMVPAATRESSSSLTLSTSHDGIMLEEHAELEEPLVETVR